jgi:hypothetical protein
VKLNNQSQFKKNILNNIKINFKKTLISKEKMENQRKRKYELEKRKQKEKFNDGEKEG